MSRLKDDRFFSKLPVNEISIPELMVEEHLFYAVPEDWHVVVTDIKNSTIAVQKGQHRIVNLVATGSIIAALNQARRADIQIPFFFGGDGASLILPDTMHEPLLGALRQLANNTARDFDLELRVGSIPVVEVYRASRQLLVSKARLYPIYHIPLLLGDGLKYAETMIKSSSQSGGSNDTTSFLDLAGMECRWDTVAPPVDKEEVVCLLVEAIDPKRQGRVFRTVLEAIERIYGDPPRRNPISIPRLRLKTTLQTIRNEMRVKLGRSSLNYLLKNWILTLAGKWYFQSKDGKTYVKNLVELSDTLVIDGRINTVICGTSSQRLELEALLHSWEEQGSIRFGLYACSESIMSCYVRDRKDQHIHFVDGGGGGYTQAAKMLKEKAQKKA